MVDYGLRIFLVEDDPDHAYIAMTIARQVLGEDVQMLLAQNASEANEMIEQFTSDDRPDLFLVDLRLPDDGGFAVLSNVAACKACAGVPVVVVTSSIYDRDIATSYELGASAVIFKPLSRAQFRAEMKRIGALGPEHSIYQPPSGAKRSWIHGGSS